MTRVLKRLHSAGMLMIAGRRATVLEPLDGVRFVQKDTQRMVGPDDPEYDELMQVLRISCLEALGELADQGYQVYG